MTAYYGGRWSPEHGFEPLEKVSAYPEGITMDFNEKLAHNTTYGRIVEEADLDSMRYLFQCFVGHEDTFTPDATIPGPEAIYTGTFEQPRIMLARTDLPGGPMGDEMWYRLTVGLERKVIQW